MRVLKTGNKVNQFQISYNERVGRNQEVESIAFSPDGKRAATTNGREIRVYDMAAGSLAHILRQEEGVTSLAFDAF